MFNNSIKRIVCTVAAALMLSSCTMPEIGMPGMPSPPEATVPSGAETVIATDAMATEIVATEAETTEYVEPVKEAYTVTQKTFRHISADDITFYDTVNDCNFAVITSNGKDGIIDYSGNLLQPIKYDYISTEETAPFSNEYVLTTYYEEGDNYYYYHFAPDGSMSEEEGTGWGFIGGVDLYWYNGGPIMFEYLDGLVLHTYSEYKENEPRACRYVPLQQISNYRQAYDDWGAMETEVDFVTEKYAFYDFEKGTLITDFIYDDYDRMNCFYGIEDDIIAVCKNGKWGYINNLGEEITDFVYDAISDDEWSSELRPTLNGYTVVYKDGKYGLIDMEGKTVVEPIYENISEANKYGEVWIKNAGTWDVWQIVKN